MDSHLADHRFPLDDLDLSRADRFPDLYDLYDLYDLGHVVGWEPSNLHDLAQVFWVGSVVQYVDPAQHFIAAG